MTLFMKNERRFLISLINMALMVLICNRIAGIPDQEIDRLKDLLEHSNTIDTAQVNACYTLAKYFLYDSTLQAQQYAMRGIDIAAILEFGEGKGHCQNMLAMSHEILGRLDEALIIYEEAFESLSIAGQNNFAAGIIVNMGVAHYYSGNKGEALKCYLRALDYARQHQLREQESKLLNNIGVIYRELKQYTQAIQIYRNSLQIKKELNDSLGYANTLENLGLAYSYLNDGEKSVQYLNDAIRCYVRSGRRTEADQAQLSLGQVYLQLGKWNEAEELVTLLLDNKTVRLLPHYEAICYLMFSKIKFEKNENKLALQYLDRGYKLIENSDRDELKSKYLMLYTDIFRSTGHYEEALRFTLQHMSILDTLNQKNRIETEREMKAKFDLQEREAKLFIQEQKIAQQTSQRLWFAALLMISLILLVVLTFFAISKTRDHRILLEKNKIIDQSLREKEILLKEIHHRVKNNLQVVSSLLSLQARSLKGKEALEAMAKGKDRVRSMALIHQNLYQEDQLTAVNSKDYIDGLCRSLLNSYSVGENEIKLTTSVEPLLLDIDTVIPLGLIINELISNAIKYAFRPDTKGEISVSLTKNSDTLELVVTDNGVGMATDSFSSRHKMGYRLIQSFVQKLKGTYDITVDHGTKVAFSFRSYQMSG